MYVLRVSNFVEMTYVENHQTLLARGALLEYRHPSQGTAAFVSHQWCGDHSPDPFFRQLVVLQRIVLRAAAGTLAIRGDLFERFLSRSPPSIKLSEWAGITSWLLWYDYFSVPQLTEPGSKDGALAESMAKAISSLADYIDACRYFIVLAPSVVHENGTVVDYGSWRRRGWCRFERLAQVLSSDQASILLVRNDTSVFEVGAEDCFTEPVGRGSFTDDRDRERLCSRVQRLLQKKLQYLADAGRSREYCHWLGARATLLRGLPADWWDRDLRSNLMQSIDVNDFLELVGAQSATKDVQGISPLLVASSLGDMHVVETLINQGANIRCKEPSDALAFLIQKGMQPIHCAATHGHSSVVSLLLRCRAKVDAKTSSGRATPAFYAASFGHEDALHTLLEHRADLNARDSVDTSVLSAAIIRGQARTVQWLIAARASLGPDEHGVSALSYAAACGASGDIVQSLVGAGIPLEHRFRPCRGSIAWCAFLPMRISYKLGRRDLYSLLGHHLFGATPLLVAAAFGNVGVMRVLLASGASPTSCSDSGQEPESLYTAIDPSRPQLSALLAGRHA